MFSDRRVRSRNLVATKAGSPIIHEQVIVNATGPKGAVVEKRIESKALVRARDGTDYHIPVNKNGKVPEDALYGRFCDEYAGVPKGQAKRSVPMDLAKSASVVHEIPRGGFTPEQIVDTRWWQNPGECDIAGIDDPQSMAMREWEDTKGTKREASKRIAIIAGPEDRRFIERTLASNFTGAELKAATDKTGVVIMKGNPGRGKAGVYYGRQPGVSVPKIVLRMDDGDAYNEDTVTHEFVHHMRASDPRRKGITADAFPRDEFGVLDSAAYHSATPKQRATMRNMEEAGTVAETDARTKRASGGSGYYQHVKGQPADSYRELYEEDRELLMRGERSSGPVTGRRAVNRVEGRFADTHISGLRVKGQGATALEGYAEVGAVKPKKATAKKKPAAKSKAESSEATKPKSNTKEKNGTSAAKSKSTASGSAKPKTTSAKKPASKPKASSSASKASAKKTATKRGA